MSRPTSVQGCFTGLLALLFIFAGFLTSSWACLDLDALQAERCDPPHSFVCPVGDACVEGICTPVTIPPPPGDGGTSDLSTPADGMVPTMSVPCCQSGVGFLIGQPGVEACACPGLFSNTLRPPPADYLCAPGYDVPQGAAGIDLATCRRLQGFYMARQIASRSPGPLDLQTFLCQPPNSSSRAMIPGCGRSVPTPQMVTIPACSGFDQALDCDNQGEWICAMATELAEVSNQVNRGDGAICKKKP